jgi:hypothetical protein
MGSWIRAISNEKPSLPVCAGAAAFCDFGSQENKSDPFSPFFPFGQFMPRYTDVKNICNLVPIRCCVGVTNAIQ